MYIMQDHFTEITAKILRIFFYNLNNVVSNDLA